MSCTLRDAVEFNRYRNEKCRATKKKLGEKTNIK
jgi:hypothetical protein